MNPGNRGGAGSDLATKPIPRLMLKYALPSVVAQLVMAVYNIADQVFIGRSAAGYLGNAATTVAFPLVTIMLALSLLIGNGSAAFISLQMGKGNYDVARKIATNCVVLLLGAGTVLAVVVLLFLDPILRLLGATELVLPYARDYASIICLGAPFAMCTTALANVIRADGSPRYSMLATMTGALLNIVLDPIFIYPWGLNLGVKGAALATILSQFISAMLGLWYMARMANTTRIDRSCLKPSFAIVRRMMAYGSSSFVTQVSNTIVNITLNNTLIYYGAFTIYGSEIPLSSMGIVMKINTIVLSAILGIVIGCQPILGFNYGAGNYARVRRTYLTEIGVTFTVAGILNLLFVTTPGTFIGLFGEQDPMFNEYASLALRTFLCCVAAAGIQIPSANYFQAVGKPLRAMTLTMTRQLFLLVPAALILPMLFGLNGALYAGPFADVTSLLITGFFITREMRNLVRLSAETPAVGDALTGVEGGR